MIVRTLNFFLVRVHDEYGLLISNRLASGDDPEGCRVMRVRKSLRRTAVVLAWLGLFAALLLTLNKLPGTLLRAAPTAVSSRSAFHSSGSTLECIASTIAAFLPGFRLTEFLPGAAQPELR